MILLNCLLLLKNLVMLSILAPFDMPGLFLLSFFCISGGNVFPICLLVLLSIITIDELVLFGVLRESSGGRGFQSLWP